MSLMEFEFKSASTIYVIAECALVKINSLFLSQLFHFSGIKFKSILDAIVCVNLGIVASRLEQRAWAFDFFLTFTLFSISVLTARGLLTKGKNGTNNCFVTIALGKEKFQTSIKDKAVRDVDWREECEL